MRRRTVQGSLEVTEDDLSEAGMLLQELIPEIRDLLGISEIDHPALVHYLLQDFEVYLKPRLVSPKGVKTACMTQLGSVAHFNEEYLSTRAQGLVKPAEDCAIGLLILLGAAELWLSPIAWRVGVWSSPFGRNATAQAGHRIGRADYFTGPAVLGVDVEVPGGLVARDAALDSVELATMTNGFIDRVNEVSARLRGGVAAFEHHGRPLPLGLTREHLETWLASPKLWLVPALQVGRPTSTSFAAVHADPLALAARLRDRRAPVIVEIEPREPNDAEIVSDMDCRRLLASATAFGFDVRVANSEVSYYFSPGGFHGLDVITRMLDVATAGSGGSDRLGGHTSFAIIPAATSDPSKQLSLYEQLRAPVVGIEALGGSVYTAECAARFGKQLAPAMVKSGTNDAVRNLIAIYRVISNIAIVATARAREGAASSRVAAQRD